MALTTVALVKARLGIPSSNTAQDALLADIVAETDDILKDHLRQNVESATYTEYYKGNGGTVLILRQRPVQSITSIHVDADGYYGYGTSPFATADLLVAGTDYVLDLISSTAYSETGFVRRIGAVWPALQQPTQLINGVIVTGLGNIKVVYVAGYPTVPKRYQAWATKLACWKFATDLDGVVKSSESHSDTTYSYSLGDLKGMSQDEVLYSICGGAREWAV